MLTQRFLGESRGGKGRRAPRIAPEVISRLRKCKRVA